MTTLTITKPGHQIPALIYVTDDAEARYLAALLLVDQIEPATGGGLARAYYSKAGVSLVTLNKVERAIIDNELAGFEAT